MVCNVYAFRAGEISLDDMEKLVSIMNHPRQFDIPDWFLNRQRDIKDGKSSQIHSNILESKLRDDIERLKK